MENLADISESQVQMSQKINYSIFQFLFFSSE